MRPREFAATFRPYFIDLSCNFQNEIEKKKLLPKIKNKTQTTRFSVIVVEKQTSESDVAIACTFRFWPKINAPSLNLAFSEKIGGQAKIAKFRRNTK